MARKIDTLPIEKKLADLHGISPDEVRKIWKSQFALVEKVIARGNFEAVRLPYFGRFYVKPNRVAHLNRVVQLAAERRNVREAEGKDDER